MCPPSRAACASRSATAAATSFGSSTMTSSTSSLTSRRPRALSSAPLLPSSATAMGGRSVAWGKPCFSHVPPSSLKYASQHTSPFAVCWKEKQWGNLPVPPVPLHAALERASRLAGRELFRALHCCLYGVEERSAHAGLFELADRVNRGPAGRCHRLAQLDRVHLLVAQ